MFFPPLVSSISVFSLFPLFSLCPVSTQDDDENKNNKRGFTFTLLFTHHTTLMLLSSCYFTCTHGPVLSLYIWSSDTLGLGWTNVFVLWVTMKNGMEKRGRWWTSRFDVLKGPFIYCVDGGRKLLLTTTMLLLLMMKCLHSLYKAIHVPYTFYMNVKCVQDKKKGKWAPLLSTKRAKQTANLFRSSINQTKPLRTKKNTW